ncbi:MAG: flotillin family protein, partial [Chloroflexi bacterium]|nr:flotillin family protein [Chloroflexota bacterium]
IVAGLLAIIVIFILIYASRYVKAGPNEVLVISGRRHRIVDPRTQKVDFIGFRLSKGGGTFVWPVLEKCEILSLELMTIDVKTPEVYSITGVPVTVDGVAQMKVRGDDVSIRTSAEQFLSKTPSQIQSIALQTLEGHLRAIIGKMSVEELFKDRDKFAQNVQNESAPDFANMGLQIVSFTIKEVRDTQGYLDALGKPRTAEVQRDAEIGRAKAQRDQQIQIAEAQRDAQMKSAIYMQDAKKQIYESETKVAEYQKNYEKQRADYNAEVNVRKAESDLAYDLQKNKTQQAVKLEEMKVIEIEKERQIEIRQKDLQATIQKPADAERYRVQQIAEAAKYQAITEAEARAATAQKIGVGEAEAIKAKGLGEAEAIRA